MKQSENIPASPRLECAHVDGAPLKSLESMVWVGDLATLHAQEHPKRIALIQAETGHETSYRELDRLSHAFAKLLELRGLKAGDRIAYLGKNNDLYFAVLFGSIRAQVILVPLNWRLAAAEIAFQLQDSGSSLLFHDVDFESLVTQAMRDFAQPLPTMATERCGQTEGLRQLLIHGAAPPASFSVRDLHQVVLLLYTSGTTGNPKGVMISHQALSTARHCELQMPGMAHFAEGGVTLSAMPNFHIGGLSWVLMGLMRGSTVVVTADPSPENILALIRRYDVEHTFLVPTVLRAVVDAIKASDQPAPRLKGIFYGAMPVSESLLRGAIEAMGCLFGQYFGMTENTGSATYLDPCDHDLARPHLLKSVGKPYHAMSLEIRRPDGNVCKVGEDGEIWIRSPTALEGYWNLPEKTSAVLVDGWYATGDGGYLDAEGYLFLTDRIKDMIVSGGENIYPNEVEEALRRHPGINDAAVVGVPDVRWGEAVVAVVELRPGVRVTEAELRAFAREHVAAYKCPKRIHLKAALPRTASGKVKRAELRVELQSMP